MDHMNPQNRNDTDPHMPEVELHSLLPDGNKNNPQTSDSATSSNSIVDKQRTTVHHITVESNENERILSSSSSCSSAYSYRHILYLTYTLTTFIDRCWEFASIIYIAQIYPYTLFYSSLYGIVEASSVMLFSSIIASYIDRYNRLYTLQHGIIWMDSMIVCGYILLFIVFRYYIDENTSESSDTTRHDSQVVFFSYLLLLLCGGIIRLSRSLIQIALSKDWMVVICESNHTHLTYTNAVVRRVDLLNGIIGPLSVGILSTITSSAHTLILLTVWTLISLPIEYYLCRYIYDHVDALQQPRVTRRVGVQQQPHQQQQNDTADGHDSDDANGNESKQQQHTSFPTDNAFDDRMRLQSTDAPAHPHHDTYPYREYPEKHIEYHMNKYHIPSPTLKSIISYYYDFLHHTKHNCSTYIRHPLCITSIAYSLLYLSIINFGSQMTAYLSTQHFSEVLLAVARGIAATVGVISTVINPLIVHKLGLAHTALLSVWLQLACITPLLIMFLLMQFTPSSSSSSMNVTDPMATIILISSVSLSRFGLWSFDMNTQQLLQEHIESYDIASFNSTQEALVNLMYLLSFTMGIVFHDPSDFIHQISISSIAVLLAALLYTSTYKQFLPTP